MPNLTGEDLRAFRAFLGFSQGKFALELGCSIKMLYLYESGRNKMSKPLQLGVYYLMQKHGYELNKGVEK